MPSANLAAVFQPCILSHPAHDQSPDQYRISQDCLVFMIDNFKSLKHSDDSAAAAAAGATTYEVIDAHNVSNSSSSSLRTARRALSSGASFAGLFKLAAAKEKENNDLILQRATLRRYNTVPNNLDKAATALEPGDVNQLPLKHAASTSAAASATAAAAAAAAAAAIESSSSQTRNNRWSIGSGLGRRSQSNRSSIIGTPEFLSMTAPHSTSVAPQRRRSTRSSHSLGLNNSRTWNSPAMNGSEFFDAETQSIQGTPTHSIQHTPEPFQRQFFESMQQVQSRGDSVAENDSEVLYVPKRTASTVKPVNKSGSAPSAATANVVPVTTSIPTNINGSPLLSGSPVARRRVSMQRTSIQDSRVAQRRSVDLSKISSSSGNNKPVESVMLGFSPRKSLDNKAPAPSKPRRQGSMSRALFGIVTRRPAPTPPLPKDVYLHQQQDTQRHSMSVSNSDALAGAGAAFHRYTQSTQVSGNKLRRK